LEKAGARLRERCVDGGRCEPRTGCF
jgi:hypothetical protein